MNFLMFSARGDGADPWKGILFTLLPYLAVAGLAIVVAIIVVVIVRAVRALKRRRISTNVPSPQEPAGKNWFAIAGMILGIAGVALSCMWYIALPCAIIGLIPSILAKKKAKESGIGAEIANAGLILCVIALVVTALLMIIVRVLGEIFQLDHQ